MRRIFFSPGCRRWYDISCVYIYTSSLLEISNFFLSIFSGTAQDKYNITPMTCERSMSVECFGCTIQGVFSCWKMSGWKCYVFPKKSWDLMSTGYVFPKKNGDFDPRSVCPLQYFPTTPFPEFSTDGPNIRASKIPEGGLFIQLYRVIHVFFGPWRSMNYRYIHTFIPMDNIHNIQHIHI